MAGWWLEKRTIARTQAAADEQQPYEHILARHTSPLSRASRAGDPRLQRGKERNVTIAAGLLDGLVVHPHQIFSYHHIVGRPSRRRGFEDGLELRHGAPSHGVGGGCCQISNMLFVIALRAGMKIIERHRHALDMFPDDHRTIPFGCGATIFYNYADFRFENPLPFPVLLRLRIEDRILIGELLSTQHPGWSAEIYEVDHRFFQRDGVWFRENRLRRRFVLDNGAVLLDQEIAHTCARVMYEPEACR
jgi:vancomycin resistance protein VanW